MRPDRCPGLDLDWVPVVALQADCLPQHLRRAAVERSGLRFDEWHLLLLQQSDWSSTQLLELVCLWAILEDLLEHGD